MSLSQQLEEEVKHLVRAENIDLEAPEAQLLAQVLGLLGSELAQEKPDLALGALALIRPEEFRSCLEALRALDDLDETLLLASYRTDLHTPPDGPRLAGELLQAVALRAARQKKGGFSRMAAARRSIGALFRRKKGARKDLVKPKPYGDEIRLPNDFGLINILTGVYCSLEADYERSRSGAISWYRAPSGLCTVHEPDALPWIVDQLGVDGMQILFAAVDIYVEEQQHLYGKLPEYDQLRYIKVKASDVLRVMGRTPRGKHGGYSRDEQTRVRNSLTAAAKLEFSGVTTAAGRSELDLGRLLELRKDPPEGEDSPEAGAGCDDTITISYMLGRELWELLRCGSRWLPRKLLNYHPVRQKYEVLAGCYLSCMLRIRANKSGQDTITLGAIEKGSGIGHLDPGNKHRRLQKLEKALHTLAGDGIIGGVRNNDGSTRAIIANQDQGRRSSAADRVRRKQLRLMQPGSQFSDDGAGGAPADITGLKE